MTDEEKAEEWLDERYLKDMGVRNPCKKAFLAGLRAGRDMAETDLATIAYMQGAERYKPKWHDLRKNPNDIPESHTSVLNQDGDTVMYDKHCQGWRYNDADNNLCDTPIAWCEIPTFKE